MTVWRSFSRNLFFAPYLLLTVLCCGPFLSDRLLAQQPPAKSSDSINDAEVERQRVELSQQDQTYFRSRIVFKYDHKFVPDDVSKDRFRTYVQYAFGSTQRWVVTSELPIVNVSSPTKSTTGTGDLEFNFGYMPTKTERFRQAIGTQLRIQSASDPALGGAATVMKALYLTSFVMSSHWVLDASVNYAHSVHLRDGAGTVSTIEPEYTISHSFPWFTFYIYGDNYFDFPVSKWGNTIQGGLSKSFGKQKLTVVSVYDEYGLNSHARAGFKHDVGVNITRYFGK